MEKLLDAGPELLLFHPTGGSRVQDPGLHDELEKVLQGLKVWGQRDGKVLKSQELTQQGMKGKGTFLKVRYPHGFLDVVLPNQLCRAVHVPLQTADELPGERAVPGTTLIQECFQPRTKKIKKTKQTEKSKC